MTTAPITPTATPGTSVFKLATIIAFTARTFVGQFKHLSALAMIVMLPTYLFTYWVPLSIASDFVSSLLSIIHEVLKFLFMICAIGVCWRCIENKKTSLISSVDDALARFGDVLVVGIIITLLLALVGRVGWVVSTGFEQMESLSVQGILTLLAMVLSIAVVVFFSIRLYCVITVAVLEQKSWLQSFKRSYVMTRGYFWHLFTLNIIVLPLVLIAFPFVFFTVLSYWEDAVPMGLQLALHFALEAMITAVMAILSTKVYALLAAASSAAISAPGAAAPTPALAPGVTAQNQVQ